MKLTSIIDGWILVWEIKYMQIIIFSKFYFILKFYYLILFTLFLMFLVHTFVFISWLSFLCGIPLYAECPILVGNFTTVIPHCLRKVIFRVLNSATCLPPNASWYKSFLQQHWSNFCSSIFADAICLYLCFLLMSLHCSRGLNAFDDDYVVNM